MTSVIVIPFMETFIDNTEIYVMHRQQLSKIILTKSVNLKTDPLCYDYKLTRGPVLRDCHSLRTLKNPV